MHYVYCTLSSDQVYTATSKGGGDMPVEIGRVAIAGKANIPDKRLITPRGAVTRVTDEELAVLRGNEVFRLHEENGFVMVSDQGTDPEKAAAEMSNRDQSAPLEEGDYAEEIAAREHDSTVTAPVTRKGKGRA